jgi:hypothetical protein
MVVVALGEPGVPVISWAEELTEMLIINMTINKKRNLCVRLIDP